MSRRSALATGCAVLLVFLVQGAPALASTALAAPSGFDALMGKAVPGAPSDWLPIANPYAAPEDVAGTVVPPIITGDITNNVYFFDFKNSATAATFYKAPPVAARMELGGILEFAPMSGTTGVASPSKGLDLRTCLWAGGPHQGGAAEKGEPSGGALKQDGQCSKGTNSSLGTATILRRGPVVVLVIDEGTSVVGRPAAASSLRDNTRLARGAVQLLTNVGLAPRASARR